MRPQVFKAAAKILGRLAIFLEIIVLIASILKLLGT
jgi:hypothetical protein